MADPDGPVEPPLFGETWAYESIVGALPGLDLRGAPAVAVQVVVFEALVLGLGWWYGLRDALVPGTVAVAVAGVGSVAMLRLASRLRRADLPAPFSRVLFGSSLEVVLTLFSFVGLLTYLFVYEPQTAGTPLLTALLGPSPPAAPVFLTLLVLWDLCYRIGTSWWTAVVAAWAVVRLDLPPSGEAAIARACRLNVGFGLLQMALLPFVAARPVLAVAVAGHVVAVTVVSAAAAVYAEGSRGVSRP